MHPLVSFYLEKTPDSAGRYLDDILMEQDLFLEKSHDYIQWLFPNRDPSPFNPEAPTLTDEVIEEFKSSAKLKKQVRRSLDRMIAFYEMDEQYPWWCTKKNHNYLRCTRILHTLKAFGMEDELEDFFAKLRRVRSDNAEVTNEAMSFWEDAYEGERDYLIIVTVKAEVSATRSIDVRAASLAEAKQKAIEEVEKCAQFVSSYGYQMSNEEQTITSIEAEEE